MLDDSPLARLPAAGATPTAAAATAAAAVAPTYMVGGRGLSTSPLSAAPPRDEVARATTPASTSGARQRQVKEFPSPRGVPPQGDREQVRPSRSSDSDIQLGVGVVATVTSAAAAAAVEEETPAAATAAEAAAALAAGSATTAGKYSSFPPELVRDQKLPHPEMSVLEPAGKEALGGQTRRAPPAPAPAPGVARFLQRAISPFEAGGVRSTLAAADKSKRKGLS